MSELRGRALIESRYGKLGSGHKSVVVNGAEYDLATSLARMDLQFEDSWPIDLVMVAPDVYCVRYYDGQDQRVVAQEFDSSFHLLGEVRGHISEWIGEENYYEWFRAALFRSPISPGDDL
jgi:hypothetical protein